MSNIENAFCRINQTPGGPNRDELISLLDRLRIDVIATEELTVEPVVAAVEKHRPDGLKVPVNFMTEYDMAQFVADEFAAMGLSN